MIVESFMCGFVLATLLATLVVGLSENRRRKESDHA